MEILKKLSPHLIAIAVLLLLNAIYFYPAFSGKILEQDDIKFGVAKSKELIEYREATGEEALWTNSMFGGMPTFQLNTNYPKNVFEHLERLFKFYQPAQIGLILALMVGFYFLLISYKVNPWLGVAGAIAFGFSAFFIISFGAGHNAKIRAGGYAAPMLMGILLVFKGKRWLGLAFTALFAGMAISANHIQITYYATIIALIIAIVELIEAVKNSTLKSYGISIGVLLIAAIMAIGPNVSKLWTTYEYSQETIRGGDGLDKEYAMSWSYGKLETFNLIIPNATGGGSSQNYEGTETHNQVFNNIKQNLQSQGYPPAMAESQANRQVASLFYWGDQTMVNGGYYLGASIFFFFILGCLLIRDKRRIWVLSSVILAIIMAWGKNIEWFNELLFNYLPLYNKFRVPSMTFFIVFMLMPFMGILGLDFIIKNYKSREAYIKKNLMNSIFVVGGLFLAFALLGPFLLGFQGPSDQQFTQNPELLDMIISDRKDLLRNSAFRSLAFAGIAFGLIWLLIRNTIKPTVFSALVIILIIADLWTFDKQHLNEEDFVKPNVYAQSYTASQADQSILKDDSYYRVFNLNNPFNDAATSYFHKSVGGYHGAKIKRYQQLYENVIFQEQNAIVNNLRDKRGAGIEQVFIATPALNMMNAKYIIYNPGAPALTNPEANGGSWFVKNIEIVKSPEEVLNKLGTIDTKEMALLEPEFQDYHKQLNFSGEGNISLTNYSPREMLYQSSSTSEQFAVFSEIYYQVGENDWQAYIDGEAVEHIRVNYVLRGMKIPAGDHEIRFEFKPRAYFAGEQISLTASIVFGLVFLTAILLYIRKDKSNIKFKNPD